MVALAVELTRAGQPQPGLVVLGYRLVEQCVRGGVGCRLGLELADMNTGYNARGYLFSSSSPADTVAEPDELAHHEKVLAGTKRKKGPVPMAAQARGNAVGLSTVTTGGPNPLG